MKRCTKCHKSKPLNAFYPDRSKKHGYMARCIECSSRIGKERRRANPEKERARNARRYWANRDKERERHTVRKYGVSLADYAAMLKRQKGRCAVCRRLATRTLDIDHDHRTGRVRGLLCTSCNRMIGHAGDNPKTLRAAAAYLSRLSRRASSKRT